MLKLVALGNGQFDLAFDDPALADDAAAIETLVYAVLYTDAEAPDHREPDRYDRRGWWADPAAGTGLWHVRRQPLSRAARIEAKGMIEQALLDHGVSDLVIDEAPESGNVSGLFLSIAGTHNGRTFAIGLPL